MLDSHDERYVDRDKDIANTRQRWVEAEDQPRMGVVNIGGSQFDRFNQAVKSKCKFFSMALIDASGHSLDYPKWRNYISKLLLNDNVKVFRINDSSQLNLPQLESALVRLGFPTEGEVDDDNRSDDD